MLKKATPARNTPRKRGRKTLSEKELRERHEAVAAALANGKSKGDIKRELGTKWDVCPRTMENYIARAREILSEWHDFAQGSDSRIELIAEVTKTFRDTMHAEKSSFRDKTDATAKLAKLFGLDAPMRMAQTKTDGTDIDDLAVLEHMNEEELLFYLKMTEKAKEIRAKLTNPASDKSA